MSNNGGENFDKINDFNAVKISLADPKKIREESKGEVKKPETVNYRSYKPERDGLFCERIFGPEKDWECSCGKYRGMKYKGMTCDRCHVKITHSRVRRKRMGHIELAAPVVHIWFFRASYSRLATLLGMKASALEKVVYFQDYVVIDGGDTSLKECDLLSEEEYREAVVEYGADAFKADMGAEAIRELLKKLDVVELSKQLREELVQTRAKQKRKDLISRLRLVEALRNCKHENNPAWMVLEVIPVIPPDLRPLVLLDSGTFATSDLNDLYRRIINRNNRLEKLKGLNAPDVIIRNEKRMLQQAVDALFDNMRCKRPVMGTSNRPLKSLTDMIKGKQGRFRENLLGKRVDYSARSVIVVGPRLLLHQCGLPKPIALELYQPFIIRKLKERNLADTLKSAKKMLERRDIEVWDILEEVIQNHPVLLNRAPTLHRMGIQAFEPILVEGNAIKLHPLVCKGFNADFDGDQMAVHLPLSLEAQVEAHTLMLSTNNIFSPASGRPIISPSQDIVLGCYYVTLEQPGMKGEGMIFSSVDECMLAFSLGKVHLQAKIKVRMPKGRFLKTDPKVKEGKIFETTPGRIIFNQILKEGPYYNIPQTARELAIVISDCYERQGRKETIDLLDKMMRLGFEESTKSGLSFAADDLITPPEKKALLEAGDLRVQEVLDRADSGLISEDERHNNVIDIWGEVIKSVTEKMMESFRNDVYRTDEEFEEKPSVKRRPYGYVNPVYLMAFSGARGGTEQIRQLAGMRGLMAKPNGEIIESPVKANFLEGLTVLEYFSSTHGARKGLSDTALKTADSGYLTRKLADVAQNCVVTMHDCGSRNGVVKSVIQDGDKKVPLSQSIVGRVSCVNVADPINDDESIVRAGELITIDIARKIDELNIPRLKVRSPMTCDAELGVCALCYGMDLSTSRLVEEGMAVGIIAAQSIGEPGTQLTMRTFHIGGAASHSAETNEVKTKYAGTIKFSKMDVVNDLVMSCPPAGGVQICNNRGQAREVYRILEGATLKVKEGDAVDAGTTLAVFDPHSKLLIAKSNGIVRFEDIESGDTVQEEEDIRTGQKSLLVLELKGDRHPRINVQHADGTKINESYQLPSKTTILVSDGSFVERGDVLAKMPQSAVGAQDITSGLPRVTEVFEARSPKDPAVVAEISGMIEISEKRSHGKKLVVVRRPGVDGDVLERVHEVPQGKRIRVFTGDEIQAGQPITDGQLDPKDILRISGEQAIQDYLVQEVQEVYRNQAVGINDKHIEIIVAQMLRKVKIEDGGDTTLLAGDVVDKFEFNRRNRELRDCVKVKFPGDTDLQVGDVVPREVFDATNEKFTEAGGAAATGEKPKMAAGQTQLLGITKAAIQSDSFLSAASFQETTKVLTEAALAYKVDQLVGLKENVILGRLIPAGTGFKKYREARWDHRHGGQVDETFDLPGSFAAKTQVARDVDGSYAFNVTPDEARGAGFDDDNAFFKQSEGLIPPIPGTEDDVRFDQIDRSVFENPEFVQEIIETPELLSDDDDD
ncbi:MAG: DNA-directed RNA polymerase subunit beta' [Thermoguttaceae bacterium]|nr:DNA-directed RNA polymerase subunit beta' [Thermoguttaceae bacterium]